MTPLPTSLPTGLPAGPPRLPERINVLVLDDHRFDRHRLCRMCSALPMKCMLTQADSLQRFAAQLEAAAYDLIFVDYSLPDGSGMEALEMIARSARNATATRIMVTGYDSDDIVLKAMSKGCADYITKDELSPAALERAVTNGLQKSMLSAQVQSQMYARAEVERVLNRFATQCVSDIKPMVSRMIRQLRTLREAPQDDRKKQMEQRASAESSCLHLWEFLDELEQHSADVMMKDLIGVPMPQPEQKDPDHRTGARGSPRPLANQSRKRPPSPFSWPTQ